LLFSKGIQPKNLQKSFASATTLMKKLKKDLSSSCFNKLLQSLLRSRKKERVTTTLLAKITTITTKKKKRKRMMIIGRLILLREVRRQVLLELKLSSIAAILIINFLNYNFTPTMTTTSRMVISEKEYRVKERGCLFVS
jgi:hypothetical protein